MTASPTTGTDIRDMLVVHDSIRRQFGQAPALAVFGMVMYGADPVLAAKLDLERQWLHAVRLSFVHPTSYRQPAGWGASPAASGRRA